MQNQDHLVYPTKITHTQIQGLERDNINKTRRKVHEETSSHTLLMRLQRWGTVGQIYKNFKGVYLFTQKFYVACINTCQELQENMYKDICCDSLCNHEKLIANLYGPQVNVGKIYHGPIFLPSKTLDLICISILSVRRYSVIFKLWITLVKSSLQ